MSTSSGPEHEQPAGPPADQEVADSAPEKSPSRYVEIERYLVPTFALLAILSLVLLYPMLALYALILAGLLTPIVLLHEWGHYRVAKKAGLGIEEFSVGFGKRLWSREHNGVRWSLKMIPLGGSVEVRGMTVEMAEKEKVPREEAFIYASPWVRLSLAMAGVRNNLILAWLGFTAASIYLAPPNVSMAKVLLLAPLNGILVLAKFLSMATHGLVASMVNWQDHNVSSILSMPESLQSGVTEATSSGMALWVYFVLIFALINLSLAVFNLLPLFPLDGYHGFVALLDAGRKTVSRLRSKSVPSPLSMRQLAWYNWSTGILLGVFVGSIFVRDIIRMMST